MRALWRIISERKMKTVIQDYKHTYLFYVLATIIPWSFWGLAVYISHSPYFLHPGELASLLAFVGLVSPVLIVFFLVYRNKRLMRDMVHRMINV